MRIATRRHDDFALANEELDRLLAPETPERSGNFVLGNGLQGPVQRKETRIAAEVSAAGDRLVRAG